MADPTHPNGLPAEKAETRQVALPLLGTPSLDKDVELKLLQGGILSQLQLPPTETNEALAEAVVLDCVRRGLGGRSSLRSDETISPVFAEGLRQRMAIKAAYKAAVDSNVPLGIASPVEVHTADIAHISSRFAEIEDSLPVVRERFSQVQIFQTALFNLPQLQHQADRLRQAASEYIHDPDFTVEQEIMLANNRLFANLINVAALQRGTNLFITPDDMLDFRAMWNNNATREMLRERILLFMGNAAHRLGTSPEHTLAYTEATLEEINIFFAAHQTSLTEENLLESPFVFASEDQTTIRREFSDAQLTRARDAFTKLETAANARKGGRRGLITASDVKSFSPLDIYFIFHYLVTTQITFDLTGLKGHVPLRTFIAALDILQADQYMRQGTTETIPEFEVQARLRTYDVLKQHVMDTIARMDDKSDTTTLSTLQSLPFPVLFEYLGLHGVHNADVYQLGGSTWAQIAVAAHISVDERGNLFYPPGTNLYGRYFDDMPEEMRENIIDQLRIALD